jgi:hypothetical protein
MIGFAVVDHAFMHIDVNDPAFVDPGYKNFAAPVYVGDDTTVICT